MQIINWKINKADRELIKLIVARAVKMAEKQNFELKTQDMEMDLVACHNNGCPLYLQKLLDADDFTFAHDVYGIRKHINRKTGQLENCFLPRLAA